MPFCKDREYRSLVSFGAEKKDDDKDDRTDLQMFGVSN